MGSNKTTPVSQTTSTQLAPEAQQLLGLAMPHLSSFSAQIPGIQQQQKVAGFDPLQLQGQQQVLDAVPSQQSIVGSAGTGNQFLTSGDVLMPGSNPALQATIDASTRPIVETLLEQALPAIRSGAIANGQFGGSRQGIGEGLAIGRAATAVGDTAAKVANQGYQSGLDAMVKGQSLAPAIGGAQALPGLTTSGVGDVRQGLAQAELSSGLQSQLLPLLFGKELAGIAAGIPGGSTTTTASTAKPNTTMQAVGLGLQALPMMMSLFSDPRGKTDIEIIGRLFDGTAVYRYKLLGDEVVRIGLMANEVDPNSVTDVNGVQVVNYGQATERAARMGGGLNVSD